MPSSVTVEYYGKRGSTLQEGRDGGDGFEELICNRRGAEYGGSSQAKWQNLVETSLYGQFKNLKYSDSGITGLKEGCYQRDVGGTDSKLRGYNGNHNERWASHIRPP